MVVTCGLLVMNASPTLHGHGLVYAFNLTVKENKFYFYFYFGGKEDVWCVYNGNIISPLLLINNTKEGSRDSQLPLSSFQKQEVC